MTEDRVTARWIRFGTPVALFVLALGVRASPWRDVHAQGLLLPPGNDVFYHLRRIAYAVFQGGSLVFDPYLNHPEGAKPIWTPLFDRASAALLAPFVPPFEQGGLARLEALAMWIPPLLGAATVLAVWALTRRHWGEAAGALAGGVLALLSAHFWYSQLGFVDHHAAVALAAAACWAAGLAVIAAEEKGSGAGRAWVAATGLGLASGLALLLWPGCLLHVGLVHLGLLGFLLGRSTAEDARRLAARLAGSHAVAFACVAPSGLSAQWPQWGAASPVVLSHFQPLLFGVGAATLASAAALWTGAAGRTRGRRAALFAAVLLALVAVLLLALPELRAGAGDAWRWLARAESFQAQVSESAPLFHDGMGIPAVRLSLFVFVLPLAALWLWWRHRQRPDRARVALSVLFALGLFAVTLFQKRFFNSAALGLAWVAALGFVELWRMAGGSGARRLLRSALVAGGIVCLLPTLTPYARYVENEWRALRGEPQAVTGIFLSQLLALQTMHWLRDHTPETSGWLDASVRPEYGVLAPWPLGHMIEYVARRPTLVDNFGDDLGEEGFAFAEDFYLSPESDEGMAAAARRGVRYVLVQGGTAYLSRRPGPDSLARALYQRDGSGTGSRPAVTRLRLVHESGSLRGATPDATALLKVFERVPGARIEGRAATGRAVALRVGITTNRGRGFRYEARVLADARGRYVFRVPYANGPADGGDGVRVAPLYRLLCGDEVAGVAVSEPAVQSGASVPGPSLCAESPH